VVRLFPVWGGNIVNGIIQKKVEALKMK
jgi:hypothetical protein